jgi:uncharacterized protein (TIGR02145 family)
MKKNKITITAMYVIVLVFILAFSCKKEDDKTKDILFNDKLTYGSVSDIDGNLYKTIIIGTQTWMAENLKVTHYRNNNPIPNISITEIWDTLSRGAYCDFDSTQSNSAIYGKIYNYYTITDTRNLCPDQWHVATAEEWITLIEYLGGSNIAGGKLKESSFLHWFSPNTGADNSSGFTALPVGIFNSGTFNSFGIHACWWIAKESDSQYAWVRVLNNYDTQVESKYVDKRFGLTIRCIHD